MRRKLGFTVGVMVAIAATAGVVFASQVDDGPGQGAGPLEVRAVYAHRVTAPSTFSPAMRDQAPQQRSRRRKPQVIYLETESQTLPAGKTGFVIGDCPGRAKALSGYYFVQGQFNGFGLENEGDSPAGPKRWAFYLDAEEPSTGVSGVIFGVVCIKGVA